MILSLLTWKLLALVVTLGVALPGLTDRCHPLT
ncbi:hypothetical protein LCGC14_1448060 [marine sediment metagenome]|uniref:Uncharacterized protein n=1 Tax=marine sediment metagenome TaxID=412755 RepID=A0A0F9LZ38_9ZZZZ